ncbi:MAG: two-component system, OmpR family, response regulator RegX3 [Actinomycetota bacterium]|nr:two-component system, OmpR family, response regulator RegX3 [Actinomycetota bacterium]
MTIDAANGATGEGSTPSGPILVVEDEEALVGAICYQLQREGFDAVSAVDGLRGLDLFRERAPVLVILDLMLPHINGLDLCRIIRGESEVPIIILTAKDAEADKVAGLEIGADDYVTKPFSMRELVTRVRAHLRRASMASGARSEGEGGNLVAGPIQMDTQRHEVYVRGRLIELPPKEFALLEAFMLRPGKLVTRQILLSEVWGVEYFGDTRTLDVHIKRLRAKIEEDPRRPEHVKTVRGLGYKLQL